MDNPISSTSAVNGANSQGPTTPEGKARSSRNAEKHGLYSNAVLLHYESAAAFESLRQSYYQDFGPTCPTETDLVDRMIAATWRLRRLASLESAAMDHAIDAQRDSIDADYAELDLATRAHLAFDKLVSDSDSLTLYNRFRAAEIRQYDRAFRVLRERQAKHKK